MPVMYQHHKKRSSYAQAGLAHYARVSVALLFAFVVCLLGSCATQISGNPASTKVWLSDSKFVYVLPPESLEGTLNLNLNIEASYKNQVYYMDALMQADQKQCVIVGLNSFGTQIFEMDYDTNGVRIDTALPVGQMKPEYLLSDFQIAFYPLDAVAANLERAGFTFQRETKGALETRKIFDGKLLLIEVDISGDTVTYTNYLRQYRYKIHVKDAS